MEQLILQQVKRLAVILLLTAILAASAWVVIFIQALKIEHLQEQLNLRETSWQRQLELNQSQLKFDQVMTDKLTKLGVK